MGSPHPSFLQAQGRLRAAPTLRRLLPLLLTLLTGCREGTPKPRINVVFISIDALRADHLHSYGYQRPTSPNLDKIARQGALFENVIAESSWTLPTHISMLTGLSSYVHGVERDDTRLDEGVPRLASRLHEEGYRTKGIYSGPYLDPIFGFGVGFDEYEAVYGDPDMSDLEHQSREAGAWRSVMKEANQRSHRTITSPGITEKAIDFFSRNTNEPFFLFLHYFDVHYDYVPPESLWRKFDPDYEGDLSGENFRKNPALHPEMDQRDLEHLIALYDAEILFTDQHIGYLLDGLERNGLTERTLLVVTSDHGEEFFEHGGKGHRKTLFDEVLKVPLLLRLPNHIPPGLRISSQVRHVDLMPTILSLLDVPLETSVSGANVADLLSGSAQEPSTLAVSRLFLTDNRTWVSARTDALKYLVFYRGDGRREALYDLTQDPREQEPIALRVLQGKEGLNELNDLMDALAKAESIETSLREAHGGARPETVELPDEVEERLRSLGYIQ